MITMLGILADILMHRAITRTAGQDMCSTRKNAYYQRAMDVHYLIQGLKVDRDSDGYIVACRKV